MAKYKNITLWLAIAFSSMVFFWLNNKDTQIIENIAELELPENPPDVYITGMDLTRFDANGNVVMTTAAETLAIYEQTGESYLSNPLVTLAKDTVQTWQITSRNAVLYKNEDIDFINDVIVLQLDKEPATQMNTEFVKITNQGDLVLTDKPVQFIKGKQSIYAIGMEAKLDTIEPIIHLLSDVSFQYDPSK